MCTEFGNKSETFPKCYLRGVNPKAGLFVIAKEKGVNVEELERGIG